MYLDRTEELTLRNKIYDKILQNIDVGIHVVNA
jgi:hypothetical protein